MKQPQRLIHGGSPRARALLSTLEEDVPPDPVRGPEKILRALQVPAGPASEPPASGYRRWLPLMSIAGLIVASAVAFGVSQQDGPASLKASAPAALPPLNQAPTALVVAEAQTEAPAAASPPAAEAPRAAEAVAAPEAARTVDVHALASAGPAERNEPSARPARPSPRRDLAGVAAIPAATPSPAAESAPALSDELQLLERAQTAASRGRADEALSLVANYRRDFPLGRFAVEMGVVEIEALAQRGRIEEAATRGERFLKDHPGSPYTRRVEAIVRSRAQKDQPR